jgi:hypothetical protein
MTSSLAASVVAVSVSEVLAVSDDPESLSLPPHAAAIRAIAKKDANIFIQRDLI